MLFYIETLGCKVNAYESDYIKETLINEGFSYCEDISKVDVAIVNTCSVTNASDSKSLKLVRSIRRKNDKCILVVCGCSTQNSEDEYKDLGIDIMLGTKDKSKVPLLIKEYIRTNEKFVNICNPKDFEFENMEITTFSQIRAYIKIQDGCENFCSYCVIPFVRGKVRFKDYNDVLKEATTLASNGFKEIVLTGIHTGSYPGLVNLINDISLIEGIKRIRLSSIEITELKEDFLELLKNNKVLCSNLHIPLQAGSNDILRRMNRKYDLKYFENTINKIRSIRKDINISTDIIVGHPYETEENFSETIEFCKNIKFTKIHVFSYSDRTGTAASRMDNHVNPKDIKIRSTKLHELSKELEKEYQEKFIDTYETILVEENKDGYFIGHTDNFLKIKEEGIESVNSLVDIKITKFNIR